MENEKAEIKIPEQTNVRIAFFAAPCAGKSFRVTQLSENIYNKHIKITEFTTDLIKKRIATVL